MKACGWRECRKGEGLETGHTCQTLLQSADALSRSSQQMLKATGLMGADEVGTLKGLTERRAILDRLIGEHRDRIANTAGDSVL